MEKCSTVNTGSPESQGNAIVRGEILFDGPAPDLAGAMIYVRLEDVTRAGAPSHVVAEEAVTGATTQAIVSEPLSFVLSCETPDPQASYSVRVHIDIDGDGRVSSGDYITMESYPVLTHGNPDRISVRVHPIG